MRNSNNQTSVFKVSTVFIEVENLEFPGSTIKIMVFIEIAKLELTGGHIKTVLFIKIAK